MFVLRAEIVTIFGSKMVTISARNINILKICKLRKAIFSVFYNILQPNFAILLILISSLQKFTFFCLNQKLVEHASCLLFCLNFDAVSIVISRLHLFMQYISSYTVTQHGSCII